MKKVLFCTLIVMSIAGCSMQDDSTGFLISADASDFSVGLEGWVGDFADYPTGSGDSAFYELRFEYTNRPSNLGPAQKAILLSGNNHSDDLFMFIKKKVAGLRPNTEYIMVFDVEFASNAEKNYVGVGGAPGESVYVKAGASSIEPRKIVDGDFYRLNIDKGNQSNSGSDMIVIGNIAVDSQEYNLTTRSNSNQNFQFRATSNSSGELWLIVGTDSGFEGTTTLYYTKVNVVFSTSN
jgi:hypothetical protein